MLYECNNAIVAEPTSSSGNLAIGLTEFMDRFLQLPLPAKALLPIWVLHTFVFEEFEFTPYLNIASPEPGCGKTTVGDVLSALTNRATSPMCGSAAVLRRKIAAERPTLILDEWDSLEPPIRRSCLNFLNTGFRQDGTFSVVVGGKILEMSTYCPKAIIGRSIVVLPEATRSRCITFTMQKALPNESIEKFRAYHRAEAQILREHCEQWAEEFRSRNVRVHPVPPKSLNARQQDICEPLLAIADNCCQLWPQLLRDALVNLLDERQMPTPENELLRAIQRFIQERKKGAYFLSGDFCAWANEQEETPWSEKPLTPAKLAEMLRIYRVFPDQINRIFNGKQKNGRGYYVDRFADVFVRYIDSKQSGC